MIKPVIRYTGIAEMLPNGCAFVTGVIDHPKLPNCTIVTTSLVEKYWPHDRSFSTMNSVYEYVDKSELEIEDVQ